MAYKRKRIILKCLLLCLQNDEGAPLMCFSDDKNTWELQGILSHHENCGRNRHPSVYTTMNSRIQEWIFNTTGGKMSKVK